jgi:mannose-1-phosphate guanylyltransferase
LQAVILAGGVGTRLRPLTARVPKPIVTLVDRPFIAFMLEWLRSHDVDDVILSCGFLAESVREVLGDGAAYAMRLRYVDEPEPLGTGGAIKHAEALLDERFLVCNGDVLTDMNLSAQIVQHEQTGAAATLALISVEDPSAYGLVRLAEDCSVREFFEKPAGVQANEEMISAGAYVLERSVVDLIPAGRPVSIEREIWPALIGNGLYGYAASGYWLDIGSPQRYMQASFDIIQGQMTTSLAAGLGSEHLSIDDSAKIAGRVVAPALIGKGCELEPGVKAGGLVVLGRDVKVGEDAKLERVVVLDGAQIGARCVLRDCVIAERARIGAHTEVSGGSVIGADAVIGEHNVITRGARISPGVVLGDRTIEF